MKRLVAVLTFVIMLMSGMVVPASADASEPTLNDSPSSLTGQWYGTWYHYGLGYGAIFSMQIYQEYGYVIAHFPEAGLFYQGLPAYFGSNSMVVYAGPFTFTGSVTGNALSGWIWENGYQIAEWTMYREIEVPELPELDTGISFDDLPPLYTVGDGDYCTELLPFDPDVGAGYIDYPVNGETWDDQYRSYARRDLMNLVKYATAKVECVTADWDYWDFAPLGLIDMSEADGSIPGTSTGYPGHPPGTHLNGNDIDLAYYTFYSSDNWPRSVGDHYDGYFEAYHLTGEPVFLDPWRTALLIAYLSEHPYMRVIGVDGKVGPVIEDALDELVLQGYIDADLRESIPLAYEVEDQGYGWYYFHHHHLHLSMNPLYDIASLIDIKPETLNRKSEGRYITGYIELVEGLSVDMIDISNMKMVVDGHTAVPAERGEISDYNNNGIPDLTLKFDRRKVTDAIGTGEVEVALTGTIYNYYHFQETDTISVMN